MSAAGGDCAVLVLARAPRAGNVKRRLEPLLGPDGAARLQAVLIARAARWARDTAAPGAAYVAHAPAGAGPELAALVPEGVRLVAQQGGEPAPAAGSAATGPALAAAVADVAAATGLPIVVVGTAVPSLGPDHADAVAADLAAGLDVLLGPATDGGCYLLALRAPRPELLAAGARPEALLGAAHRAGLRVGVLRSERPLRTPGDAAALLADPCAPGDVRAVLGSPVPDP